MSDEAWTWLQYAHENLQVAEMTLQARLLNPYLQNSQQAIEKALKAIRIHSKMPARRTHSIRDLNHDLVIAGIRTGLTEEDCELLDSVYVGSKYPLDSVLPNSLPDPAACLRCVGLAKQVLVAMERIVETKIR
jgi:HEPN domain-containing protein